ncbi:hypothetical protein [Maledivibacter halophilus]|uniref:Uncharacterized protein n=1 Tax=Maledivibacter halophilus TaxID=36842 RepID=A0A1T5MG31_9FIRM|nr:hypothetical protein [Maledivibacter halophilus]SKC87033.1 hypothetical protein SAMN02194393_04623 [Maledivibacter halophilus]
MSGNLFDGLLGGFGKDNNLLLLLLIFFLFSGGDLFGGDCSGPHNRPHH